MFDRVSYDRKVSRLPSDTEIAIGPDHHWSPSVQTLLDQPASVLPVRFALAGFGFVLLFSAWAWFGRINEVAYAQGKLIPKGAVYKVNPTETGKVARLQVKEGQTVKAGQPLLELDPVFAATEIEALEKQLAAEQIQLGQTQNLMVQLSLQAQTRSTIAKAGTEAQKVTIAQAQNNVGTSETLIKQLDGDATAQQERINRLQPLMAEGAISREQIFQMEQALRDRQRTLIEHQGSLKQNQTTVDRLQVELGQKHAEEQQFQLEAQQQLQQLKLQISQLQAKIEQTQTQLKAAQAKRQQRIITAPVSGLVSMLQIQHAGEVVQIGQPLAEISPQNAPLVMSALLPSREAGLVKVGMTVQLKFDAFPYQSYGTVSGKVTRISPDAQPNSQLGQVYDVEVAIKKPTNSRVLLKAGQTGTVEIVTRNRRIVDVLLDPIKQLQSDVNL